MIKSTIKKYLKITLIIVVIYLGGILIASSFKLCPAYINRMPMISNKDAEWLPRYTKPKLELPNLLWKLGFCPFTSEVW